MKEFYTDKWEQGVDYDTFRTQMDDFVREGKTSGPHQVAALTEYTKLNNSRLKKWHKITRLTPKTETYFKTLKHDWKWLMIVEAWCGDVAQNLSTIHQMANLAGIPLRLIYRDENLDLMDRFLTRGSRSIPILIVLDGQLEKPFGQWGPRPEVPQQMMQQYKASSKDYPGDVKEDIHRWYALNRQKDLQMEIMELMTHLEAQR